MARGSSKTNSHMPIMKSTIPLRNPSLQLYHPDNKPPTAATVNTVAATSPKNVIHNLINIVIMHHSSLLLYCSSSESIVCVIRTPLPSSGLVGRGPNRLSFSSSHGLDIVITPTTMNPANRPAKKPINSSIYITRFSSVMADCSIRIEALI